MEKTQFCLQRAHSLVTIHKLDSQWQAAVLQIGDCVRQRTSKWKKQTCDSLRGDLQSSDPSNKGLCNMKLVYLLST